MTEKKPWGGRFSESTHALVEAFTASIEVDRRLYRHDIRGSIAHARMLADIGVLTAGELRSIEGGLETIRAQIERGEFEWSESREDIHINIEAKLVELIGDAGKKLHTARSRNDQSPPTCDYICASNWTNFAGGWACCNGRWWKWRRRKRPPSCPA